MPKFKLFEERENPSDINTVLNGNRNIKMHNIKMHTLHTQGSYYHLACIKWQYEHTIS